MNNLYFLENNSFVVPELFYHKDPAEYDSEYDTTLSNEEIENRYVRISFPENTDCEIIGIGNLVYKDGKFFGNMPWYHKQQCGEGDETMISVYVEVNNNYRYYPGNTDNCRFEIAYPEDSGYEDFAIVGSDIRCVHIQPRKVDLTGVNATWRKLEGCDARKLFINGELYGDMLIH